MVETKTGLKSPYIKKFISLLKYWSLFKSSSHGYLTHLKIEVRFEIKENLFQTDTGLVIWGADEFDAALL